METKEYAKGTFFDMPHENAPDFVVGRLSIKVDDFIEWIGDKVNNAGYINLDITQQKSNPLKGSVVLNTYKRDNVVGEPVQQGTGVSDDISW